ncbi:DNA glycosylase AlkZ-like family protein [candidate division KSB1 bacterium]
MNNVKKKQLTIENIKSYRLKKSFLSESSAGENINEVINRLIAIDSNDIKHSYLVFYNRLKYFSKTVFDDALYQSDILGRFKAMRTNYFIIPIGLSEIVFSATYNQRDQVVNQVMNNYKLREKDVTLTSRIIIKELESGDKSKNQLSKKIPKDSLRKIESKIGQAAIRSSQFEQTLNILLERWQIIPGKEKWDTMGKKFCLFEELHKKQSFSMDPNAGENNLILKYISGYGPVLIEDIAWWCGIPVSHVEKTLKNNIEKIAEVSADDFRGKYYIMKDDLRYLYGADKLFHDSLFLLGKNDPFIVGYKEHNYILTEKLRGEVVNIYNESEPVVLLNGEVAGKWSFEEKKNTINISICLFKKIKEKTEDRICREIDRLSDFIGDESKETTVDITYQ